MTQRYDEITKTKFFRRIFLSEHFSRIPEDRIFPFYAVICKTIKQESYDEQTFASFIIWTALDTAGM